MAEKVKIPIDESRFSEIMRTIVEPQMASVCKDGTFTAADGYELYWRKYIHANPSARIVICNGFGESCDKYTELAYIFFRAGCSVYLYDQRGNGKSKTRAEIGSPVDVCSFYDYVDDLDDFVNSIVAKDDVSTPLFLLGHSVGGAVAAVYLENYPNVFDAAVLTSPVFNIQTGKVPQFVVRAYCMFLNLIKKGDARAVVFDKINGVGFDGMTENLSAARALYKKKKEAGSTALEYNGFTFRWLGEMLSLKNDALSADLCDKVETPVLVFSSSCDELGINEMQHNYAANIANGTLVEIKDAAHDIFMSKNEVLKEFIVQMLEFFASQVEEFNNK